MSKIMSGCLAALVLIVGLSFLNASSVTAQTPVCGLGSTWNGQTCIGPRGKAYCPAGMTMQGETCVSEVTQQNRVVPATGSTPIISPRASADVGSLSDHERIIAMLSSLTAQESQQQAVINDLQQKMIAMQIVINLMAANVEKTRVAALAAQASAAAAQQTDANIQASNAQNGGISQSQLMTNVNILLENDKTLLADDKALQTNQTDIARRLYYTCLRVQGIANGIDAGALYHNACTSTFWMKTPPDNWVPNWDTPFSSQ